MSLFHGVLTALALLMGTALSLLAPLMSHAAGGNDPTAGCGGSWRSGDGAHGVLVVDCAPGFASSHDRLYVYPRRAIIQNNNWRAYLDTTDAVWLFDAGVAGRTSLLVDFHPNPDGPGLVADLYDDPHGSGRVDVRMVDGAPAPIEKGRPTVRVTAPDGWWRRDGVTNFNLTLRVDGPVFAAFGADRYLDRLRRDGRPDFVIQVRDRRGAGRPDYEWIDAWPDAPSGWQISRTELMVNTAGDEPPIEGSLFWPYLGTSYEPPSGFADGARWAPTSGGIPWLPKPIGVASGFVKDYGRSFPPLQIFWPAAKIATVGEFVGSRGNGSNYFVYSTSRLDASQSDAAFENPFAFYDLAGAHDGHPDLAIRSEYDGPHDPAIDQGRFPEPVEMVRYSWDQFHRHRWDFKVDLLGRHAEEGAVALPGLTFQSVPYENLPTWVTGAVWDAADFVAVEGSDYASAEVVYESLSVNQELRDSYLTGMASTPPPEAAEAAWPVGLRGESRIAPNTRPDLYYSPIDHRLHLLGADHGLWRVDETRVVRYANLGGDYINVWSLVERGAVTASLSVAAGQAILSDGEGVRVKMAPTPPASFTVRPPTNHDDWSRLGALLAEHRAAFAGGDLVAMFDQIPGPAVTLRGASTGNFRTTTGGLQLTLTVPTSVAVKVPNAVGTSFAGEALAPARITGEGAADPSAAGSGPAMRGGANTVPSPLRTDAGGLDSAPNDLQPAVASHDGRVGETAWPATLAPGAYLVRYQSGTGYAIERLRPAALSLAPVAVPVGDLAALEPVSLSVAVSNGGNVDAAHVSIAFTAARDDGVEAEIGAVVVDVPAGEHVTARSVWTPPMGGRWSVRAHVDRNDGDASAGMEAASPPVMAVVMPVPSTHLRGLLAVESVGSMGALLIGALLVAVMAAAAGLSLVVLGQVPDAPSSSEASREHRR